MQILLIAATEQEIAPFMKSNPGADILITGVGAPACMYALTKKLHKKKYDLAIQAGIAGSFKKEYAPGETVIVKQDVFADLGIFEKDFFYTLFDKGFAEADTSPYTRGRLLNDSINNFSLPEVNAITVNTISDKLSQTEMFIKKYDSDIESMEGAAFHYACISEGLPFIQLRSISNVVGERNKANWKMKGSIENLNGHLQRIIREIKTAKA